MDAAAVVRELCFAFSRVDVAELLGFFMPDAACEKVPAGRISAGRVDFDRWQAGLDRRRDL